MNIKYYWEMKTLTERLQHLHLEKDLLKYVLKES